MIVFDQVTYRRRIGKMTRTVLSSVNAVIPSNRRIAIISDSNDGRAAVVDLLAGMVQPYQGRVSRSVSVSFPAGDVRMFTGELSVRRNVEYVARLYGAEPRPLVNFVERAIKIGPAFDKPYVGLQPEIKKIISHLIAYCLSFDVYVLRDGIKTGNRELRLVTNRLLRARAMASGVIVPTRNPRFAKEFCDMAIVVKAARMLVVSDIEQAFAHLASR
jgi:capsular polysaccharide transport system ATP-binding protein